VIADVRSTLGRFGHRERLRDHRDGSGSKSQVPAQVEA
jgi:hypothetical protein